MTKKWEVVEKIRCFDGFFKIDKYTIKHTLYQGGWTAPLQREIFERGSAAAVLPYDPHSDKVLLIEQFRIGALGEATPWLLEVVAGIVEAGESPEDVVRREAVEEAGITLLSVEKIQDYLVSPGGTTEKIFLYYAEADLSNASGVHGLAHEGEDILVKVMPSDAAFQLLDAGKISNAMTIIALQWLRFKLARHAAR